MSTGRKRNSKSQVNTLDVLKKKVQQAEAREERLKEKRSSYQPKPAPLKYAPWKYELRRLETGSIDLEDMRKEYSKLRSIANKRLQRISKTEFVRSEVYQKHQDLFPKLAGMTEEQIQRNLAEVVKFLNAKRSSLEYMKREKEALIAQFTAENARRELLNELHGGNLYDYLPVSKEDQKEYWSFLNFLNSVSRSLDSRAWYESMKDMFGTLRKRHLSWKEILEAEGLESDSSIDDITTAFEWWKEHENDLQNYEKRRKQLGIAGKKATNAREFKKFFERIDKLERS